MAALTILLGVIGTILMACAIVLANAFLMIPGVIVLCIALVLDDPIEGGKNNGRN